MKRTKVHARKRSLCVICCAGLAKDDPAYIEKLHKAAISAQKRAAQRAERYRRDKLQEAHARTV